MIKVDFHQKIHLLHYNSLFVHLFFVFFVINSGMNSGLAWFHANQQVNKQT